MKAVKKLDEVPPQEPEAIKKFFTVRKDDSGNFKGFKIDRLKFLETLYGLGFRRFDIENSHFFVQVYNHRIIKEVTRTYIEDCFFNHLNDTYDKIANGVDVDDLVNYMLAARGSYFNEEFLYRLKSKDPIIFQTDSRDQKYLFYKNNYVLITPNGIEILPYPTLTKYIWENEILQREINKLPDYRPGCFEQFIERVSITQNKSNRMHSMQTIIGYNLHNYYEGKLKATVFTDSRISNDDEPNGRTGKTLFCKALAQMISSNPEQRTITTYCEINGKDFDTQSPTKYQAASLDTKIIVLNDVKRGFDVETLFNDITEGINVKRLYKEPFRIRAKMIITTNKTIRIEGDSSKDRFIEFEFSDFFNKQHSPEQEYKHWFFRDWDKKEWLRFDHFMIRCIKIYLEKGVKEAETINLQDRKLRDNTNADFIEWIENIKLSDIKQLAEMNDSVSKNDFYADFRNQYSDFQKLTQNKFSRWVKYWGKYNKHDITIDDQVTKQGRVFIFKKIKQ